MSESPASDAEIARMLELLARDIACTGAAEFQGTIPSTVQDVRDRFNSAQGESIVQLTRIIVDELQHALLDSTDEILWPACPRHPSHALLFRDQMWYCDRNGEAFSPLGGLSEVIASVFPDPRPVRDPGVSGQRRRRRPRRRGRP